MNKLKILALLACVPASAAIAQQQSATGAAPAGEQSLAATLKVYVFPSDGQAPEQQSKDEAACYQWAVQNTGTDPFAAQKQAQAAQQQAAQKEQQIQQAGKGAGAKGAVGGAAAGALIGEIASNDAGEGAAWGAAAGAVIARRKAKRQKAEATEQVEAQAQQAQATSQQALDGFRKAFSVCLESKKYMVKF